MVLTCRPANHCGKLFIAIFSTNPNEVPKLENHYFQAFSQQTRDYLFSKVKGEPADASPEKLHEFRLLALIRQVRQMALNKYFQMPEAFTVSHSQEDWVQEAFIIMLECRRSYDQRNPFDHYVRFMVSKRLVSMQRKVFSQNPPADRDLYKKVQAYKRKHGCMPTAKELAQETGCNPDEIQQYLENGYGQRLVASEAEALCKNKEVKVGLNPETQYIHHEARQILWECIEALQDKLKLLFIRHEIEAWPFKKLYQRFENQDLSFSTFKRWYREKVYTSVESCVSSRYNY